MHVFVRCYGLLLATACIVGCSKNNSPTSHKTTVNTDTIAYASYTQPYVIDTSIFHTGFKTGTLNDPAIQEASGLAASYTSHDMFWTHNDHGNPNTIFLIDTLGKKRETCSITNATNRDWEDIKTGPGPTVGVKYIYLGEIGDNNDAYPYSAVYRFPEPRVALDSTANPVPVAGAEIIKFVYPDGPNNCETLLLDPLTKDLYVLSKSGNANVYMAPYPQPLDSLFAMKKIAVLPFSTLTAGDISPDGSEIVIKNYDNVYYWKRGAGETVLHALLRPPVQIPYVVEAQGEGICFTTDASAFYTTSEVKNGIIPGVWKYKRK